MAGEYGIGMVFEDDAHLGGGLGPDQGNIHKVNFYKISRYLFEQSWRTAGTHR